MKLIEKLKEKIHKNNTEPKNNELNNQELENEMKEILENVTPTLDKDTIFSEKGSKKLLDDLNLTEEEITAREDEELENAMTETSKKVVVDESSGQEELYRTQQLETLRKSREELLEKAQDEYLDTKTR